MRQQRALAARREALVAGVDELEPVPERVDCVEPANADVGLIDLGLDACRGERAPQTGKVVDEQRDMRLPGGHERPLDAEVDRNARAREPATATRRERTRLGHLRQPEQPAVERARLVLAAVGDRELDVVGARDHRRSLADHAAAYAPMPANTSANNGAGHAWRSTSGIHPPTSATTSVAHNHAPEPSISVAIAAATISPPAVTPVASKPSLESSRASPTPARTAMPMARARRAGVVPNLRPVFGAGPGRGAGRPSRRPGRGGPRPSTPRTAWCPVLRSGARHSRA